ncbi:MAG: hypothetical protein H0V02_06470 [Nocardioidaceae bacterium]|nr:hypothetical protein [Nocardioidaceae bacterium]
MRSTSSRVGRRACTAAAEDAAAETVDLWRRQLEPTEFEAFEAALSTIVALGRLRPPW